MTSAGTSGASGRAGSLALLDGVPGPFTLGRLPRIEFGPGSLARLPDAIARQAPADVGPGPGRRVLLVTGRSSFRSTPHWQWLLDELAARGFDQEGLVVDGEPSPALVDEAVREHRARIDVVVGIGGGSVLDTAKAVAGLLRPGNSVLDHLEGVGPGLAYRGPATPFVAVPTTAGTGSEATRNAVLSAPPPASFKKSFRDEQLVAREAIVDPELLATCPPPVIAWDGLDAVTQLLESYLSTRAGPITDALALSGLEAARDSLLPWFEAASAGPGGHAGEADTLPARTCMAYAALLSGITLAQVGLGAAHGLASPLGARFPIRHGVACGAVLAAATRVNVAALEARDPAGPALRRYARAGRLLAGRDDLDDAAARAALIELLDDWTRRLAIPRLGELGVGADDVPQLVAESRGSSMRTNPIVLTDAEVAEILVASR